MKKANIVAGATFVFGLAGFQYYAHRLQAEARGGTPRGVLVVSQDLEPGAVLSEENLSTIEVPSGYLDERRVPAQERMNLLGVPLQTRLRAGEGLVWSDLADGAARSHLAQLILPGRRAYSLKPTSNPLGQLLRVGDHVDVLLERAGVASILHERVLILAVGNQTSRAGEEPATALARNQGVTLSVSGEQARQLLEAESEGDLRLVLRNPEDFRVEEKPGEPEVAALSRQNGAGEASKREIEHVR